MLTHKSASLAFGPKHFASPRCSVRGMESGPPGEVALKWYLYSVSDALSGFVEHVV